MEIEKIANFCKEKINLNAAFLSEEYYYQSLPLCVIDSVFSIGVRYEAVRNTVNRYVGYYQLKKLRDSKEEMPLKTEQESIIDFVSKFETQGVEKFVSEIFINKQRTSTSNGILKAQAVYEFSKVLKKYGVHYLQYVEKVLLDKDFEKEIKSIKGQRSGISLTYFFMLAGSDQRIKPDRMIIRFLESILERKVSLDETQVLFEKTVDMLKIEYPHLTPRLLDHVVWNYTRNQS